MIQSVEELKIGKIVIPSDGRPTGIRFGYLPPGDIFHGLEEGGVAGMDPLSESDFLNVYTEVKSEFLKILSYGAILRNPQDGDPQIWCIGELESLSVPDDIGLLSIPVKDLSGDQAEEIVRKYSERYPGDTLDIESYYEGPIVIVPSIIDNLVALNFGRTVKYRHKNDSVDITSLVRFLEKYAQNKMLPWGLGGKSIARNIVIELVIENAQNLVEEQGIAILDEP